MTGSDGERIEHAWRHLHAQLGQYPVLTLIVERGVFTEEFLDDIAGPTWQPEEGRGGAHALRVHCGRVGGIPTSIIVEVPPFPSVRNRTFPVRLADRCESAAVIVLARAIPLDPAWKPGDLMAISDHINLLGDSPLIGGTMVDASEHAFLDLDNAYDREALKIVEAQAASLELRLHSGIYMASPLAQQPDAPARELLQQYGGHCCGTGVVPHVLLARRFRRKVLCLCTMAESRDIEVCAMASSSSAAAKLLRQTIPALAEALSTDSKAVLDGATMYHCV